MLNLMLLTATFHSKNNPKLLMVISKNLPNDTEFARVVGALQSRGIKVLLVQPHDEAASQQLFRTPESISNLVRVKPVVNQTASFYQDFSVPTTYVDAPKTGVFWDAQDSPLPNHLDPESIFQSIKSALEGKGYFAYISIWVYADEKITFSNELLDEYRKSDIYFLPKVPGDKNLRYDRMLHDIFLWEIDTPGGYAGPSNVVVISNNIKIQGDNYLRRNGMPRIADFIFSLTCLNSRSYNSFLVQPELLTLTPEPSEWPGYLFDIGEVVGFFRVAPSQTKRMRKKSSKENFAVKTKSEEDFSSAYSHIYWDVDDYPIPKDIAPNCIYHNFKLALENMGYYGTLEVNAYSEKEIPLGLDEKSMDLLRIMFIPKRSPKIALWNIMYTVNSSRQRFNVMIISKRLTTDEESMRILWALKWRGTNVLLVQPNDEGESEIPFHSSASISDCTRFLNGEKPIDRQIVDNTDNSSCTSWETDTDPEEEVVIMV
ncbi:PREDICTED: uncharacterized protein LOC104782119 [Camelina sativa]|uniref:Uncharacterized protein LOC104782119 n=1 Tax=Camelina sativa TaxID=90675 RepID=A0ABM1RLL1_CAMSA|nr:PREDICTED: uncharacterized protein LOC104782119 [Camelina sativa]